MSAAEVAASPAIPGDLAAAISKNDVARVAFALQADTSLDTSAVIDVVRRERYPSRPSNRTSSFCTALHFARGPATALQFFALGT